MKTFWAGTTWTFVLYEHCYVIDSDVRGVSFEEIILRRPTYCVCWPLPSSITLQICERVAGKRVAVKQVIQILA